MGIAVPVAAVALGACIIEKHLCLRRADGGPDSAFSLEPAEFKAMVEAVRTAEKALGSVQFGSGPHEANSRRFRRSLFVVEDIKKGRVIYETECTFDSSSGRIASAALQRSSWKARGLRY